MVSNQNIGVLGSFVGGTLVVGGAIIALGAIENVIRHKGKLQMGRTSRRIIPARIFRGRRLRRR